MIRLIFILEGLPDGIGSPVGGTRKPQEAPQIPKSMIVALNVKRKRPDIHATFVNDMIY